MEYGEITKTLFWSFLHVIDLWFRVLFTFTDVVSQSCFLVTSRSLWFCFSALSSLWITCGWNVFWFVARNNYSTQPEDTLVTLHDLLLAGVLPLLRPNPSEFSRPCRQQLFYPFHSPTACHRPWGQTPHFRGDCKNEELSKTDLLLHVVSKVYLIIIWVILIFTMYGSCYDRFEVKKV